MKTLRLLNNKYLSIIFISFIILCAHAEEKPVDIWDLNQQQLEQESKTKNDLNLKKRDYKVFTGPNRWNWCNQKKGIIEPFRIS